MMLCSLAFGFLFLPSRVNQFGWRHPPQMSGGLQNNEDWVGQDVKPRAASTVSASLVPSGLIEQVKRDLWRTADSETSSNLAGEQRLAISKVLKVMTQLISDRVVVKQPAEDLSKLTLTELKARAAALGIAEPQGNARHKKSWIDAIRCATEVGDQLPGGADELTASQLNEAIAPHLPLLMLREFPSLLREALAEVRTSAQLSAVRQLNSYMIEVCAAARDVHSSAFETAGPRPPLR